MASGCATRRKGAQGAGSTWAQPHGSACTLQLSAWLIWHEKAKEWRGKRAEQRSGWGAGEGAEESCMLPPGHPLRATCLHTATSCESSARRERFGCFQGMRMLQQPGSPRGAGDRNPPPGNCWEQGVLRLAHCKGLVLWMLLRGSPF